jgi:hypothetical protein
LEDVYASEALRKANHLKVNTFSNSILINKKAGFQMMKLPKEAQMSAVFGMVYEDFDNDGLNDIVIAGNLYNSETETPRNDAGQGLLLKGNGMGGFVPVMNYVSGLNITGDVKKISIIKLGQLGKDRKGFIVGVNNDFVQLIAPNK